MLPKTPTRKKFNIEEGKTIKSEVTEERRKEGHQGNCKKMQYGAHGDHNVFELQYTSKIAHHRDIINNKSTSLDPCQ